LRRRPAVQQTVAQVEEISGLPLQRLMKTGPRRELQGTHAAQLAIFALSVGLLRAVTEETGYQPDAVCGHSLGQFSALVAAGVMDLDAGTQLVNHRGLLMDRQNQRHDGAMLAVSGLATDVLASYLQDRDAAWLANDNAPGQLIVSGEKNSLDHLQTDLKANGITCVALDVAGAYHSPLIGNAARAFADHIAATTFRDPVCPVIANTDATLLTTSEQVREELARHMLAPVKWRETMLRVRDLGITRGIEIGAGRTMKGLWIRNHSDLQCLTSNDHRDLTSTIKSLSKLTEAEAEPA
ncbi:ACP S-malonyltransferase, partial [Leisingera sp. ANG-M1]|uniref:ACP S-malonyltransferase n=1 Tax=Leisingera sp. ANG-M1 TaxID=1577895 RepID=UPI0009E269BB